MPSSARKHAPIVVGVDGSSQAQTACAWAAREAWMSWTPLRLVYATMELTRGRSSGYQVLNEAAQRVRQAAPGLTVQALVVAGYLDDVLASQGANASMLVIGFRHGGLLRQLVPGPTTTATTARVRCPVAVVPCTAHERSDVSPVIVEVTGAEQLAAAFETAAELATHHRQRVQAVQITSGPVTSQHLLLLHEVVKPWQSKYPHLAVNADIKVGRPADVLAAMSAAASAVVVCSLHHSWLRRSGLRPSGAVSHALLRRSQCPVIIVPY